MDLEMPEYRTTIDAEFGGEVSERGPCQKEDMDTFEII
jgi:hypothetical protein